MFDCAPMAIAVTRGTDVLYANLAYLEMLGEPSLKQLQDLPGLERLPPERRARSLEHIRRRAAGLPVPDSYQSEHLRRDGTRVPVFLQVTRVSFADGPATLAFITDISEQKRAEEALRAGDRQFRTFVEQAPVAISVSRDGICLYSNQKLAEMLGRASADEFVGEPVYLLFAPQEQAECKERFRRRELGFPYAPEYESVLQRADGSQFPAHFAVGPVRLKDGLAHIASITDITERRRVEQALKASLAVRDTAERVALTGSWRFDIDARKYSWSDGTLALFGVSPADFDGDATSLVKRSVHPDDLGAVMGAHAAALECNEPRPLEFRLVPGSDGRERVIYSEATIERDTTGRGVAITGYFRDVTSLREAAACLEAAAVEWSETFDAMGDAVAVLDGDGRVVRCNAATLALTGLSIDDIAGHRCEEVFHDDDGTGSLVQRSFKTGQAQTVIVEQDGRWLRTSCRPRVDASGHVSGGVFVISDISPLRRAEEAARERTHFLEQLLNAIPVPIFYLDADLRIIGLNETYAASAGRSLDELVGKTVFDVRPTELAQRLRAADRRLLAHLGETVEQEYQLPGSDGAPRFTLSHKAAFSDVSGKAAGIVGVNLDVTDVRRAEQQLVSAAAQLEVTLGGAVAALGATTELRDPYTAGHQRRVAQLAGAIALRLGWDERRSQLLDTAARLHDVGKVVVPAEILAKPGALSDAEMQIIRQHPNAGAEIVGTIGFDPDVAEMIRQHHERLDGSGYPDGLRGGEILAETLILSVADVVEAMISHRPYRPGLPIEAAVAELRSGAGRLYGPGACDAAISLISAEGFRLGASFTF
jgi:PAS domain S-box-containing protein/putative nucleotidyltransferase with HDIG domain